MTSVTDEAGGQATIDYSGEYFWRPDYMKDGMGNETTFAYTPTTYESTLTFNSGSSAMDKLITLDGLGRLHVSQQRQGPGSSYFDTVETDYNSDGQMSRVTMPYQGTAGQTSSGASATTYTYDGAGRLLTVTDGGGGQVSYSYPTGYITDKTVSGQPTGESAKQWQYGFNSLGWVRIVCEVTGNSTDPSCNYTSTAKGYQTQYNYDAAGRILSMSENITGTGQGRSFNYDELGRVTSESNPESGGATYTYDSSQTGAGAGDLYTTKDANGVTVTYTHGAFHRLLTASTGSFCRNFLYDQGNAYSGATYVNARMAQATTTATCGSTSYITNEYFGYDADGRMTDLWESTPNSSGLYHVTDQYFPNGVVNTLVAKNSTGDLPGFPLITYGVDGEGRLTTVSASSGANPVTAAFYYTVSQSGQSAGRLATVTYGSGDSDTYSYDSATGRMTQYQFSINGSNVTGALTWNQNGTLQKLAIIDPFNSSDAQTCTYSYDGIARLTQASCPTIWGQNFSYDAYGNLSKNIISGDAGLAWNPNYNNSNQYTLSGTSYDYDGNLTADTFHTYSWDTFGGLAKVDSTTVTRDAFGRAVEFSGSTTRQFVYTPTGVNVAKMNGLALDTARVPLPGGGIADYHATGFSAYGHAEWLGTTRFGSTSTRTKDGDWAVAPFGEIYAGGSTSYTAFTGKFDDIGTNLWDFPMREYHSSQGRWISPDPAALSAVDPMNPQTWNRYAYVVGNPLMLVDPMGLSCDDPSDGILCISTTVTANAPQVPTEPVNIGSHGEHYFADKHKDNPVANNGLKQTICSAIPSGRTTGASGGVGGVGSPGGGVELVVNYNSGQVSAFAFGGMQVGWNGGVSGSVYSGFVWGLNNSNSNYSGGFTGINGAAGAGGFVASSSGGLTGGPRGLIPNPRGVTAAGASLGAGLLGGFSGGVTATNYTNPAQLGKYWAFGPVDWLIYAARQVCQ